MTSAVVRSYQEVYGAQIGHCPVCGSHTYRLPGLNRKAHHVTWQGVVRTARSPFSWFHEAALTNVGEVRAFAQRGFWLIKMGVWYIDLQRRLRRIKRG